MSNHTDPRYRSAHLAEFDALKGILIALIVLGHNYHFSGFYTSAFSLIYNFHVASFLLLPFLFDFHGLTGKVLRDRAVRTLVPHFLFLLPAVLVYSLLEMPAMDPADWLRSFLLALLIENEQFLKAISGFRHFWFLPAMLTLTVFLYFFDKIESRKVMIVSCSGLVLLHAALPHLPADVLPWFPWGSALIAYLILPGLIVRELYYRIEWRSAVDILVIGLWLFMLWIAYRYRLYLGLAGDPMLVSAAWLPRLIYHDLLLCLSFLAILRLGWWLRKTILSSLGAMALQIFLLHPLVWQVYWRLLGQRVAVDTALGEVVLVAGSFLATMGVTMGVAALIRKTTLHELLFPKSWRAWRSSLASLNLRQSVH